VSLAPLWHLSSNKNPPSFKEGFSIKAFLIFKILISIGQRTPGFFKGWIALSTGFSKKLLHFKKEVDQY
jgi:hypothetical protein